MATCNGDGTCFQQIGENEYEQTSCSHNCILKQCNHFVHCGQMRPEWVWNIHRQMCMTCAVWKYSGIQLIDEKTECPICYTEKPVLKLKCNHVLCMECLHNICDATNYNSNCERDITCPMCRKNV